MGIGGNPLTCLGEVDTSSFGHDMDLKPCFPVGIVLGTAAVGSGDCSVVGGCWVGAAGGGSGYLGLEVVGVFLVGADCCGGIVAEGNGSCLMADSCWSSSVGVGSGFSGLEVVGVFLVGLVLSFW